MKIRKEVDITLDPAEELKVVAHWVQVDPGVVEILQKNKGKYNCPFPLQCNKFPCSTLSCDADSCSNGNTFRWS